MMKGGKETCGMDMENNIDQMELDMKATILSFRV